METTTAEAEMLGHAMRLVQLHRWSDARSALHQLALRNPRDPRVRALLALARGHEAAAGGDMASARSEWARAVQLDPSLELAKAALRRRRPSLIDRLLRRG